MTATGFTFVYETIDAALANLVKKINYRSDFNILFRLHK
ncbi:MAG: hypothetical protein IPL84_03720 [Chitinophagaceae bacterium]|nr:hypothetical protein [Chitinophagaceae bacterium]